MINVQVLELQSWGVHLEQCQLVRYDKKSGTLGKPFDVEMVGVDLVCVCLVGGVEAKHKAQGVAECRMRRYAPDTSWQALVMRGKEAGRFREVPGLSIVGVGIPRSAVEILNRRQLSGYVAVDRAIFLWVKLSVRL